MPDDVLEALADPDAPDCFDLPCFCLPCGRRLAKPDPYVTDRNQARHAAEDRPRVYPAILAGVAWYVAVLALAAGLVAAAAWAVTP